MEKNKNCVKGDTVTDEIWRVALRDKTHPLHKATMLLFTERFNAKMAAKQLAPQQDEIIEYLCHILDHHELYAEGSFGDGHGPMHAVELLGEWKVVEAIPNLLQVFEKAEINEGIFEATMFTLGNMGEAIVPMLLHLGRETSSRVIQAGIAGGLAVSGRGNSEVYEWVKSVLENNKDHVELVLAALSLVSLDEETGVRDLKAFMRSHKLIKQARESLKAIIEKAEERTP